MFAFAVNWYDVGSNFSSIAREIGQDVSGLGLITSAFVAGVGVFQVPGGILSVNIGARRTVIYGMLTLSVSSLLVGFSNNLNFIALLRFIAGIGMALVFPSSVILVSRYFEDRSKGLGIGLLNAVFYVGGIAGIYGWVILAGSLGWRLSLIAGGVLGLVAGLFMIVALPSHSQKKASEVERSQIWRTLLNKDLILLGLALLGLQVGFFLSGSFMVYYLEERLKLSSDVAGGIASLSLLFGLVASLVAGGLYKRIKDPRRLILVAGLIATLGLAGISTTTIYGAVLSTAMIGLSSVGFTTGYLVAGDVQGIPENHRALGVSWMNSISITGSFWYPILFSSIVIWFDYSVAWVVAASFTMLLTLSILGLSKESSATGRVPHENRAVPKHLQVLERSIFS
jgi:MFS family permease